VEQPGSDRFIWLAVAAKQRSHLDRMGDERRVVDLPVLTGVAGGSKPQRGLRDRQPGELGRRATPSRRRGDWDLVAEGALALVCDQRHALAVLGLRVRVGARLLEAGRDHLPRVDLLGERRLLVRSSRRDARARRVGDRVAPAVAENPRAPDLRAHWLLVVTPTAAAAFAVAFSAADRSSCASRWTSREGGSP
jgi:hypothetical protein